MTAVLLKVIDEKKADYFFTPLRLKTFGAIVEPFQEIVRGTQKIHDGFFRPFKLKESQMKKRLFSFMMVSLLFASAAGLCRADNDARIIGRIGENWPTDSLRKASLYMVFNGNKAEELPAVTEGDETRIYSKVWDNLYVQVATESINNGVAGYKFSFSTDEAGEDTLASTDSQVGPSLLEISATDFRSDDNFSNRSLNPGPGTPSDRGALRVVHFKNFTAIIRVLEFNIGDVNLDKKPYFKSLSLLVRTKEKGTDDKAAQ